MNGLSTLELKLQVSELENVAKTWQKLQNILLMMGLFDAIANFGHFRVADSCPRSHNEEKCIVNYLPTIYTQR